MALKFVLRPGEKMVVNGAVIGAGDQQGSILLFNKAHFLRGREIMREEEATTLERRIYFVIQLAYLFPEDAPLNLTRCAEFLEEAKTQHPDRAESFAEIEDEVRHGNYYRALKLCGRLVKASDSSGADGSEGDEPN